MTLDEHTEHAPFVSSPPEPSTVRMRADNTWIMDDATRNRFLKKYKTQVASATSTICATLSVVSVDYRVLTQRDGC